MKYMILAVISLMFISNVSAQSNNFKDSASSGYLHNNYFFNHTNRIQQNKHPLIFNFKKTMKSIDPSVLLLEQPKLVFAGNVNHFNIYQSSPDNMVIIKPDSTFLFNMPVADNN